VQDAQPGARPGAVGAAAPAARRLEVQAQGCSQVQVAHKRAGQKTPERIQGKDTTKVLRGEIDGDAQRGLQTLAGGAVCL
jgi:hypothetical protein